MAKLIPDTIDFGAYYEQTNASVTVRPASSWTEDLVRRVHPPPRKAMPRMSSTKLGRELEFRPGEVTVWVGYKGHRKTLFTTQVCLDLCASGQRCLIASFEMAPDVTLQRMARQAAALAQPDERWLRDFARWTDDRLWIFDHLGNVSLETCVGMCRYFADEKEGQHVFIDSLQFVCESEEQLDVQKRFMQAMVRLARDTGLHVHLVAHAKKPNNGDDGKPPTGYDIRGSSSIPDQAFNIASVWANRAKKEAVEGGKATEEQLAQPDAVVLVDKQRNGAFEGKLLMWWDDGSFRFTNSRTAPLEPYPLWLDGV